jgi:hypothetical protein
MIHNSYGFHPEYNEKISGVPFVSSVKNLPKIYPKRAGAIVYYNEITEKKSTPQKREYTQIEKFNCDDVKEDLAYGSVKILKREDKTLINHKPNLINEEKISFKINEVNRNIVDNVILENCERKINRIYGFGVDCQYGTLTDFGGGIKYKYDKDPVSAALRELKEESLGLFDFSKKSIQDCCCIYNEEILIIFIPIYISPKISTLFFNNLVSKEPKPEVSRLEWISEKDLIDIIQRPYIIYEPVRSLVHRTLPDLINRIS